MMNDLVEQTRGSMMQVFAIRGKDSLLLSESVNSNKGRVLDRQKKVIYPVQNVHSILKWGYWERYSMPDEELSRLIAECTEVDTEGNPLSNQK